MGFQYRSVENETDPQNVSEYEQFAKEERDDGEWDDSDLAMYGEVLFRPNFVHLEDAYVSFSTMKWLLVCLGFLPLYGIGLFMLFWTPVVRKNARKSIRNRQAIVTSESLVCRAKDPAICPCVGVNSHENHVLLSLVTDVVITTSWLQRCYGLTEVVIKNAGQGSVNAGGKGGADVRLVGLSTPKMTKKIIMLAATKRRRGLALTRADVEAVIDAEKSGSSFKIDLESGGIAAGIGGNGVVAQDPAVKQSLDTMNTNLEKIIALLAARNEQSEGATAIQDMEHPN